MGVMVEGEFLSDKINIKIHCLDCDEGANINTDKGMSESYVLRWLTEFLQKHDKHRISTLSNR